MIHIHASERGRLARAMTVGLAAAGLAAATAGPATAATVKGTVVAHDTHRGTVATAARGGDVTTLRVSHAGRVPLGHAVRAHAVRLGDGTYRAAHVRVGRRAAHVRVRAAVVRRTRRGYLVSAGSSTFAIHTHVARHAHQALAAAASLATADLQPGDIVLVSADATHGELDANRIEQTGNAGTLEIEGIFLDSAGGQLRLAVEHRGVVTVTVPADLSVSAAPGDELELLVSVAQDGSFTLLAADGDDQGDDDQGFDYDVEDGEVQIAGTLTALAPDSLTVEAGPDATLTCSVPAGTDLSEFALQDQVEMTCASEGGAFTLSELQSDNADVEVDSPSADDKQSRDDNQSGDDSQDSSAPSDQQPAGDEID